MKHTLRQLFGSTFLGATWLLVLDAFAARAVQEFQVEGVLSTRPSSPSTSKRVQINYHGGQWSICEIRGTNIRDPGSYSTHNLPFPNVEVQTLTSDGTNIYYIQHFETNTINSASFEHPNAISNNTVATLYAPGFPNGMPEPDMAILFYAYLSTPYLNSVTNDLLDPIKFGFPVPRVRAIYKRTQDSQGLPREIVFFDRDGKRTNAVLEASSFGSRSGITLPRRVVVTMFVNYNGEPVTVLNFEASELKDKCGSVSFRPELAAGAYVTDCRFSQFPQEAGPVPAISYGVRTNWPTEAEANLRPVHDLIRRWHERNLVY